MNHFQSKTHIILWLESNCPRPAIVRALYEGQVEFYGGFNPVPPTKHPGWILRITSAHGKIRYVAVIAYRDHYGIRILRDVPWGFWAGSTAKNRTALMNGDYPVEYWELRRIWNENKW
jgi:hypothetical protein